LENIKIQEVLNEYDAYSMYQRITNKAPKSAIEVIGVLRGENRTADYKKLQRLFLELNKKMFDNRGLEEYERVKNSSKEERMAIVFQQKQRQKRRKFEAVRRRQQEIKTQKTMTLLSPSTGLPKGTFRAGEKRFQSYVAKNQVDSSSPPLPSIELGSSKPTLTIRKIPKNTRFLGNTKIPLQSLRYLHQNHTPRLKNEKMIANERSTTTQVVGLRGPGYEVAKNNHGDMVVTRINENRCPAGVRVGTIITRFNGSMDFSAKDIANFIGEAAIEFKTDLSLYQDHPTCTQKIADVVHTIYNKSTKALTNSRFSSFVTNSLERVFHEPKRDEDFGPISKAMRDLNIHSNVRDRLMNEFDEIERRKELEEEERRKAEREPPPIVKARLRPLTEDEEDEVDLLMGAPGGKEIAKAFNQTILAAHLNCLQPGHWLNDEVMNFYFNLIMKRSKAQCEKGEALRCWCFNTFFLEKLTKGYVTFDYKPIRRWTKKNKMKRLIGAGNIFDCDLCFVPCHVSEMHWTCGIINIKDKRIEYYDSLAGGRMRDGKKFIRAMKKYIKNESLDKLQKEVDADSWEEYIPSDIPNQDNGFDCGMFSCTVANFRSEGRKLQYSQDDMPTLRQRLVLQIKYKDLDYYVDSHLLQ